MTYVRAIGCKFQCYTENNLHALAVVNAIQYLSCVKEMNASELRDALVLLFENL